MNNHLIFPAMLAALFAAPVAAWANTNPDFDDDARPILRAQPGLLHYVDSHFEVKDTGSAKYPGNDDRRPAPPYIFLARPAGSDGPYNLRLLIQPGSPGHILNVVDITRVHLPNPSSGPAVASRAPIQQRPAAAPANSSVQVPELSAAPVEQQPAPAAQPAAAAPAAPQPSEPTADTPSGPIMDSSSTGQNQTPAQPSLAPPPDPVPPAQ